MAKVDELVVNVWKAPFASGDHLPMRRFRLPWDAQERLELWSREASGKSTGQPSSLMLRGLSEILAWFVPEIVFVQKEWDGVLARSVLGFFMNGLEPEEPSLRQRLRAGLGMWLGLLHADRPAQLRTELAETAMNALNWSDLEVGCGLRPADEGACAAPQNKQLYDALALHAVAAIAGRQLTFASGDRRTLIARTAKSGAFDGIELVAFPPRLAEGGCFSEVVTIYTATYPERDALHVLARPSIRNWGPVRFGASRDAPNRALDIFMPGLADDAPLRHASFDFQARYGSPVKPGERAPITGMWPHKRDQKVFDLVRRLTGRPAIGPEELAAPVIDDEGLWVLPRLGSGHGDKRLPGGSGLPWNDRRDIGQSLDIGLRDAGFERAEPMRRATTRQPLGRPFNEAKGREADRRRAVLEALQANGIASGELTLYLFLVLDDTPTRIAAFLSEELGSPDTAEDLRLCWQDGLSIRLVPVAAGPLAQRVTWEEPDPALVAQLKPDQLRSVKKVLRQEGFAAALKAMSAHASAARNGASAIGCAILEMPEALRDDAGDPFMLARRALASHDLLPQVVLAASDAKPSVLHAKYGSATSDCLRMLGVLPVDDLPSDLQPAALTIVQRNAERVAGTMTKAHAFPLAARVRARRLDCALPDEAGNPIWRPYAQAALAIMRGDYGRFGRGRQEENLIKFEMFFTTALADIDGGGPALVIVEGETVRHKLTTFLNERLAIDALTMANRILRPSDLPNSRIVRISPDVRRQPHYYHETDNKWPSGIFSWGTATRTWYGLKPKPVTISMAQSFASQISRHGAAVEGAAKPRDDIGRVSSQLDELCVMFSQQGDEALDLAALVHRLRGAHAQSDAHTARPFPLHELRLLGGGITG